MSTQNQEKIPSLKSNCEFIREKKIMTQEFGTGLDKHLRQIESSSQANTKFQTVISKSKLIITDLPFEELFLIKFFQFIIDEAMKESRRHNIDPTHIGCTIRNVNLRRDICVPIRPIATNTVEAIYCDFLRSWQYNRQVRDNLLSGTFAIRMTIINRNGLQ